VVKKYYRFRDVQIIGGKNVIYEEAKCTIHLIHIHLTKYNMTCQKITTGASPYPSYATPSPPIMAIFMQLE
jgi:hypothetical protein